MVRLSLIALALWLVPGDAFAQKKPPVPTASGTVKAVDASAGTITLAGKKIKGGGESPDETVSLAKDAKVAIDGAAGKLADVKEGAQALLTLDADKKAVAVSVNGGVLSVAVKAVDATASTITLAGKKTKAGDGEDRVLAVAKTAKVSIEGEMKTLADVKAGATASVALSMDGKTALGVKVGGKKKPTGPPTTTGVVKAVDAAALTITLAGGKNKRGDEIPDQVVKVAKDAKVSVGGEAKALADVKEGDKATITFDAEKKEAVAVAVGTKKKKGE